MENDQVVRIVDAALLAAHEPLSVNQLLKLFAKGELDAEQARNTIKEALAELGVASESRGYELKQVASGYRYQVRQELSEWVSRLWDERPPRYSRALLETLALIAYKQPVTRGDIESVRGVVVSPNIIRTLLDRGWIRAVGQREVPGRPVMYGTTKLFLDYFNLKTLSELPPLEEIRSLIEPLVVGETDELAGPHTAPDEPGEAGLAEAQPVEDATAESSEVQTSAEVVPFSSPNAS